MSEHTKEPWVCGGDQPGDEHRVKKGGRLIATVWYPRDMQDGADRLDGESYLDMRERTKPIRDEIEAETKANARRIVAAVNACAGIETETLEAGGEGWINPIVSDFVEDTAVASENVKRMYDCAVDWKARAAEAERLLAKILPELVDAGDLTCGIHCTAESDGEPYFADEIKEIRAFLDSKP